MGQGRSVFESGIMSYARSDWSISDTNGVGVSARRGKVQVPNSAMLSTSIQQRYLVSSDVEGCILDCSQKKERLSHSSLIS